jgi:hypothetical protein
LEGAFQPDSAHETYSIADIWNGRSRNNLETEGVATCQLKDSAIDWIGRIKLSLLSKKIRVAGTNKGC